MQVQIARVDARAVVAAWVDPNGVPRPPKAGGPKKPPGRPLKVVDAMPMAAAPPDAMPMATAPPDAMPIADAPPDAMPVADAPPTAAAPPTADALVETEEMD